MGGGRQRASKARGLRDGASLIGSFSLNGSLPLIRLGIALGSSSTRSSIEWDPLGRPMSVPESEVPGCDVWFSDQEHGAVTGFLHIRNERGSDSTDNEPGCTA